VHAEGDAAMLRQVYLVGLRLTFALYAAIGAALITLAAPFLSAWVGHKFASSADIVVILTIAAVFEALMLASANPMLGMSRHRPIAMLALASAVLNLALSIVLIGVMGVEGVALGTLIATTIEAAIALPYGARTVGVRLGQVVRGVIVPSLAPLVPAVAVMLVLRDAAAPTSLIAIIATGAVGSIVYGICYLVLPVTASERGLVLGLVSRLRH
jgi:O-antigen/teichoic acid export membrane protein